MTEQAMARDEFEKHPGEPHQWTHHLRPPLGVGICDLNGCGEIDWEDLADSLQRAIGNSWQAKLVRDLARCPHGRIDGDTCSGWTGPGPFDGGCYGGISTGNPRIPVGQVFAWSLSASPKYVMPIRDRRTDPAAWKTE